ncbi:hypothetical protein B9Z65_5068 [Elsinoe australis]|uniref:Uncharacterized protein n=1 Tax=Elsinoe australis TaxID=40998 RepID=A0A2P7ZD27_9PEZI|nr:hypothetical protein B9Z65_5068 [Elsinoe australis]
MEQDSSWQSDTSELRFAACSGAHLVDVALGQKQRDVDYQGEYPAPGLCRSAIEKASGIIDGLGEALQITYADIFKYYEGQPSDLNVYHTGYAHFFNTNSNWRNEKSFVSQNKLVRRQKDLSDTGPVIPDPKEDTPPPAPEQPFQPPIEPVRAKRSLGFIDITRAFDGHRFCEDDSSFWKQYYGDSTWFWNLRAQLSRDEGGAETDDVPPLSDNEVSQLDQSGMFSGEGDGNEVGNGWRLRPFHPPQSGNAAVKSIIVERLRADGVPGVESIGSVVGGAIAGILASGGKGA